MAQQRPTSRNIVRWDDKLIVLGFAAVRQYCNEQKIDIKPALEFAAKKISEHTTGDAFTQHLKKRENQIMDELKDNGIDTSNGYYQGPASNYRAKKSEASSTPKKKPSALDLTPVSLKGASTSPATPLTPSRKSTRIKVERYEEEKDLTNGVNTPVKSTEENDPDYDGNSDDDYKESPLKGKSKRGRAESITKAAAKLSKESEGQKKIKKLRTLSTAKSMSKSAGKSTAGSTPKTKKPRKSDGPGQHQEKEGKVLEIGHGVSPGGPGLAGAMGFGGLSEDSDREDDDANIKNPEQFKRLNSSNQAIVENDIYENHALTPDGIAPAGPTVGRGYPFSLPGYGAAFGNQIPYPGLGGASPYTSGQVTAGYTPHMPIQHNALVNTEIFQRQSQDVNSFGGTSNHTGLQSYYSGNSQFIGQGTAMNMPNYWGNEPHFTGYGANTRITPDTLVAVNPADLATPSSNNEGDEFEEFVNFYE